MTAGSWGPPTDRRTRLVLVRHGSTEHSAQRRFSGRNDLPLDTAGQAQAAALAVRDWHADFGAPDAVVCSPLPRTRQTAETLARPLGLAVEVDDDLVETDFGDWEGRTAAELYAEDPQAMARWRASLDAAPPGGESFADVRVRVDRALARLTGDGAGRTVVVVSHVTPIKLVLAAALGSTDAALFRIHLDTASVCCVDLYADGNASVRLVNDTSHLRARG